MTVVVLTVNMLVDIVASLLDPRQVRGKSAGMSAAVVQSSRSRGRGAGMASWRSVASWSPSSSSRRLAAPWIAPYSPYDLNVARCSRRRPPTHWLGTDEVGRDVFSRTIYAARISVEVALVAVGVGLAGGTLIGLLAAYFGGLCRSCC